MKRGRIPWKRKRKETQ
jgi:hypothetical protein